MKYRFLKKAEEIALSYNKIQQKNKLFGIVGVRLDGIVVTSTNVAIYKDLLNVDSFYGAYNHAEYRLCSKMDKGGEIYIVRVRRDGTWGNSAPCRFCRTLIKNKKIRAVHYSVSDGVFDTWYPGKEDKPKFSEEQND